MYANSDNVTHFDSFGIQYTLKEMKKFIGNKNVPTNIYRIQANNSIMWGYSYTGFTDFILKGKIC